MKIAVVTKSAPDEVIKMTVRADNGFDSWVKWLSGGGGTVKFFVGKITPSFDNGVSADFIAIAVDDVSTVVKL